jgi:hypothetical protein
MKRMSAFLCLIVLLSSCHESREVAKVPVKFKKSIGQQIPLNVARDWVNHYKNKFNAGKERSHYSISSENLSSLLGTHDNKVGVTLHHGLDDQQQHHILILPVFDNAELWSASQAVDANSNTLISTHVASHWASSYSAKHTNEIWFHFFGIDVFTEIRSNPAFNYVSITEGLNENGRQLLLFVHNTKNVNNGKVNEDNVTVYDVASQCPPCDQD